MGQIMYTYPAMLAHAQTMHGYHASLRAMGGAIGSEQGALAANWQGDTGSSYQAWQTQWNQALEQLCQSYAAMANTHEQNTQTMAARDGAEAAKWVG